MTTYSEKLRDPRWQKKRLKVLERDDWTCQGCDGTEMTLHVHHEVYRGKNPWDTEMKDLTTLCEQCHGEAEYRKTIKAEVCEIIDRLVPPKYEALHAMAKALDI